MKIERFLNPEVLTDNRLTGSQRTWLAHAGVRRDFLFLGAPFSYTNYLKSLSNKKPENRREKSKEFR